MRKLLFTFILLIPFTGECNNVQDIPRRAGMDYKLDTTCLDPNLTLNEAVYEFYFSQFSLQDQHYRLHYSIDGKEEIIQLAGEAPLIIETTPGKHIFQFYHTSSYVEVFTDSLLIEPAHRSSYTVTFRWAEVEHVVYKPVIYLYPEEETEFTAKLNIHGTNEFLYPVYENGWSGSVLPNGDITINNETYNYLFWEANPDQPISTTEIEKGFVVPGKEIVSFLEQTLTEAGLTSTERADFITFWGPKLMKNEANLLHFVFNEQCDRYADLNITPTPDEIFRIYMIWTPVSSDFVIEPQTIRQVNRNGFTVIEWGGQQATHTNIVN